MITMEKRNEIQKRMVKENLAIISVDGTRYYHASIVHVAIKRYTSNDTYKSVGASIPNGYQVVAQCSNDRNDKYFFCLPFELAIYTPGITRGIYEYEEDGVIRGWLYMDGDEHDLIMENGEIDPQRKIVMCTRLHGGEWGKGASLNSNYTHFGRNY